MMDSLEADLEYVALLKVILSEHQVMSGGVELTIRCGWPEAQRLHHHHSSILQVLCRLHRHNFV